MRQTRSNHEYQNNNFYSQNPANTDFYQPTQMQNEIPLPKYFQQHEITKNHLTNFSHKPNAAESLQMIGWIISNIKKTTDGIHRHRP